MLRDRMETCLKRMKRRKGRKIAISRVSKRQTNFKIHSTLNKRILHLSTQAPFRSIAPPLTTPATSQENPKTTLLKKQPQN